MQFANLLEQHLARDVAGRAQKDIEDGAPLLGVLEAVLFEVGRERAVFDLVSLAATVGDGFCRFNRRPKASKSLEQLFGTVGNRVVGVLCEDPKLRTQATGKRHRALLGARPERLETQQNHFAVARVEEQRSQSVILRRAAGRMIRAARIREGRRAVGVLHCGCEPLALGLVAAREYAFRRFQGLLGRRLRVLALGSIARFVRVAGK